MTAAARLNPLLFREQHNQLIGPIFSLFGQTATSRRGVRSTVIFPMRGQKGRLTALSPLALDPPQCHILASSDARFAPFHYGQRPRPGRRWRRRRRTGVGVATRTRARTKQPTHYKVLMLNDDYTPMEFVVLCLQRFFRWGWRMRRG